MNAEIIITHPVVIAAGVNQLTIRYASSVMPQISIAAMAQNQSMAVEL